LVGLVPRLFFAWNCYDTGFASDYTRGYPYILWFIDGLTELFEFWLQDRVFLFSLLAVGVFLLVGRPGYSLANRTRRPERR
jgi:hypothetical protein